ncbi:MAG: hypothetical protein KGK44_11875 [Gammaproteobacteria bacterium]|nr:hypothetical protein [Gammaproteobacteria bacterium]
MHTPRNVLIILLGIMAAACATHSPHQNMSAAARTLPVKQIYVVIAADTLVSADPGYLPSMARFKNLLREKIQTIYPGTQVEFRHPLPGISTGWEMMVEVQDFNYVSRTRNFEGDQFAGDASLRVHIQLSDVGTHRKFVDYILGTSPVYPTNQVHVATVDVSTGAYSTAAQVGNSNLHVTTGQLLETVSADIAKSLDRQSLVMRRP